MPLNTVIANRVADYTVDIVASGSYVKGRYQKAPITPTTKSLAIFPITTRDLTALPEGYYTIEDIKAYQLGSPDIPLQSVIHYNGKEYKVMAVSDRQKDGDFSYYIGKKIDDNA